MLLFSSVSICCFSHSLSFPPHTLSLPLLSFSFPFIPSPYPLFLPLPFIPSLTLYPLPFIPSPYPLSLSLTPFFLRKHERNRKVYKIRSQGRRQVLLGFWVQYSLQMWSFVSHMVSLIQWYVGLAQLPPASTRSLTSGPENTTRIHHRAD